MGGFPSSEVNGYTLRSMYRQMVLKLVISSHVLDGIVSTLRLLPLGCERKLEVYGLRVYLLESLVEIRGSNVNFDFEAKQSFLRVQAQDSSGLQSIGEIVVFVTDVNEPQNSKTICF